MLTFPLDKKKYHMIAMIFIAVIINILRKNISYVLTFPYFSP